LSDFKLHTVLSPQSIGHRRRPSGGAEVWWALPAHTRQATNCPGTSDWPCERGFRALQESVLSKNPGHRRGDTPTCFVCWAGAAQVAPLPARPGSQSPMFRPHRRDRSAVLTRGAGWQGALPRRVLGVSPT
jgi:hypothetical protein